jgi:1-acyl-sn-glycerol-3-phosphate acyltransferase
MLYHALRVAARVALRWYYADAVVQGRGRVPPSGPLLIVANHPNALVDALLVGTTVRRRVMLTAKATLFENPALAALLHAIGVVPLRRAADERAHARRSGVPVERNEGAFRALVDALRGGGAILVFPEGISHDRPAIAPLKTGAARMALEARANGVTGLRLLPLGLVYERKEQLRSRVLVRIGEPIAVDDWHAAHGDDPAGLTELVSDGLRAVTLNFANEERAERAVRLARALAALVDLPPALGRARPLATEAELALRVERATDALAAATVESAQAADRLVERLRALEDRLAERGVDLADVRISPRIRHGARFMLREGSLLALALPVALLGRMTHWIPLRLARSFAMRPLATDPSRDQPAMRTIVLGLVVVLLWYVLQGALAWSWLGALPAILWLVAISLAAQIDFALSDRLRRATRRARTYLALRADPRLGREAGDEMDALLSDAVALELALVSGAGRR